MTHLRRGIWWSRGRKYRNYCGLIGFDFLNYLNEFCRLLIKESGEKNARLVCITDYNEVNVDECDDKRDAGMQTQADSELKTVKNDKRVKISRLAHKLHPLSMLPANYGVNIIKYKLEFKEHCKRNPLYVKTEQLQPWVLLEKYKMTIKVSKGFLKGIFLGCLIRFSMSVSKVC